MTASIAPMSLDDRDAVIDIFNYYIDNTFAAYPEEPVPYEFYDTFLNMCRGFPNGVLRNESGEVTGFGMLRPYSPVTTFLKTAEVTYFIKQGHTGFGLGSVFLDYLIDGGRKKGIDNILASVSSLNNGSMRFHMSHGFIECGRLKNIGRKKGKVFDIVYYQRML